VSDLGNPVTPAASADERIVIDAAMSLYVMVTILIVLAVLMLLGAIPA